MNVLRKNIEAAKEQYKALHYPGDLAADVLGSRPPQRVLEYGTHRQLNKWLWAGAAIAAVAAAIVVVVFITRSLATREEPNRYAMHQVYDEDEVSLGKIPVVGVVDSMPTDMQLMPPAQDMSISMPSLSFSSSQSDQQQLPEQPQSNNTGGPIIEEAVL